jgi:hypothetical protein
MECCGDVLCIPTLASPDALYDSVIKLVDALGPLVHVGIPEELCMVKNCPALPFGKRVSVLFPSAYNISPFVNPVILLVDVIMISVSRPDMLVLSEDIPGAVIPDPP